MRMSQSRPGIEINIIQEQFIGLSDQVQQTLLRLDLPASSNGFVPYCRPVATSLAHQLFTRTEFQKDAKNIFWIILISNFHKQSYHEITRI